MAPPACTPGTFPVCLPPYLDIDAGDISQICAVHPSDANDGSYIVEFKREQDAFRYLKAATKARKAAAQKLKATEKSAELLEFPPGLEQPKERLPSSKSKPGIEVQISGLPKHLMSEKMLEATLDQAGLEKDVISITVPNTGKVQITLSSQQSAQMCLEHFHGRKWNPSGGAVSAQIVSAKPTPGKKANKVSSAPAKGYSKLNAYAPAYVHSALGVDPAPAKCAVASDASTNVSDEDAEEESWETDLKKVMFGCAFE